MAANAEFERVNERGWRIGFSNMLAKENGTWWRTRTWWTQVLVWMIVLNGLLGASLWLGPSAQESAEIRSSIQEKRGLESSQLDILTRDKPVQGLMVFLIFCGLALPVVAIIVGQDTLIGERLSGTAEWVLSKPVSRPAFYIAKLAAHTLGLLVTTIVFQGVVAFLQVSLASGWQFSLLGFAEGMGLIFLSLLFYLTLTLMLSTLTGRGAVLGISLAVAFAGPSFLSGAVPLLQLVTPWTFAIPGNQGGLPLALSLAVGKPLPTVVPILFTALWCLVFILVGLWRFSRQEF